MLPFLYSCTAWPLDRLYNPDTFTEDMKDVRKNISLDDSIIIMDNIMRLSVLGEDIEQMTYRQIMEDGKDRKKSREKAKEEARKHAKQNASYLEHMQNIAPISITSKAYDIEFTPPVFVMNLVLTNKSEKTITGIKGTMDFEDILGNPLAQFDINYKDTLEDAYKMEFQVACPVDIDDPKIFALIEKELDNLQVIWTPEVIIFEDGSKMIALE